MIPKFRWGDLSLCNDPRNQTKVLEDELLISIILEHSSQTCARTFAQLAEYFQVSSEADRLQLHHIGKTFELKSVPPFSIISHALSEDNKKQ